MVEEVVVNHLLEESIAAFYGVLLAHGITPHIRIPEEKVVRVLDSSAQKVEIAADGGQGRAQVMGDVGDGVFQLQVSLDILPPATGTFGWK